MIYWCIQRMMKTTRNMYDKFYNGYGKTSYTHGLQNAPFLPTQLNTMIGLSNLGANEGVAQAHVDFCVSSSSTKSLSFVWRTVSQASSLSDVPLIFRHSQTFAIQVLIRF